MKRSHLSLEYDEENIPFNTCAFDGCVSLMTLQWANDISCTYDSLFIACLKNYSSVLKKDSFFIGSLFGAGTLNELAEFFRIQQASSGTARNHCGPWISPDKFTECMKNAGFHDIVVDPDNIKCKYEDWDSMIFHLRSLALTNCSSDMYLVYFDIRPKLRRKEYKSLKENGPTELSFNIINFIGWK